VRLRGLDFIGLHESVFLCPGAVNWRVL